MLNKTHLLTLLLFISCIIGCKEKLCITKISELGFRRSYAGHEEWSDEYMDSVMRSNPDFMNSDDTLYIGNLKALGLVKDNQLLLNKFNGVKKTPIYLSDNNSHKVSIDVDYLDENSCFGIIVRDKDSKASAPLLDENMFGNTQIDTIDLIPGGFKEILVLENYYIMNGDDYFISIFKIN